MIGKTARCLLAATALCWAGIAAAQVQLAPKEGEQDAGAWSSFILRPKGYPIFRASNTGSGMATNVDVLAPDCTAQMAFNIAFDAPAQTESGSSQITGGMRVDMGPLHPVSFTVGATVMGDQYFIVTLNATPDFAALITEMESGQALRIRFDVGSGGPAIKTVPLNGFMLAATRSLQTCTAVRDSIAKDQAASKKAKVPKGGTAL
ncbi:hypothetical protein [Paraburkholderia unamae]|uniref:Invasion protein IalB n=1 Tax=Paraburkholderia unamae TaxID=219649 RepID=A0ABX5KPP1_9BURK|nr:hypothetical protein [Paraburkholderia unamae]PVX84325.1 hypothetical protein C7402_105166 [Paraburkholderia unamae]